MSRQKSGPKPFLIPKNLPKALSPAEFAKVYGLTKREQAVIDRFVRETVAKIKKSRPKSASARPKSTRKRPTDPK